MTLRQQLLLVCLSLLILPAAVFLFVGELDRNLRQSQERETQTRSAGAASSLLADLQWSDTRVRPESKTCLLYTSPSPRDLSTSRMPSSA